MTLGERVAELCGSQVRASTALSGGDICAAHRVDLADGRTVFAKLAPNGQQAMVGVEAAGLAWLAQGGAAVPQVIGHDEGLLVLAWVEQHPADRAAAGQLGSMLALLHRSGAGAFGEPPPGVSGAGWIGSAPMEFDRSPDWAAFFAESRLRPHLRAARDGGRLSAAEYDIIAAVCDALPAACLPAAPPARLHGDLWSGNVLWSARGPVLIDPAAHGGHPESDLAMLALFPPGYFREVVAGYESVSPLPPGWADRVELHQLYPLLVHARLFGGPYPAAAASAAAAALRLLQGRPGTGRQSRP